MRIFEAVFIALVVALTIALLVTDLRTRRIPNWLTLSALFLAIAVHGWAGGLDGLEFSLLGFAVGFGALLLLWVIGGAGGGDVKMMGALGAWLGVTLVLQVFLASAVVTFMASIVPAVTGRLAPSLFGMRRRLATSLAQADSSQEIRPCCRKGRHGLRIPYAVPVALSTWIVLAIAWKMGGLP